MLTEGELLGIPIPVVGRVRRPASSATASPVVTRSRNVGRTGDRLWRAVLMTLDAIAVLVALAIAETSRFGGAAGFSGAAGPSLPPSFIALGIAAPLLWLVALTLAGAYRVGVVSAGRVEFRGIANAGLWALATAVIGSYVTHADLSRQVVAVAVPAMTGLTLAGHVMRRLLHRRIRGGKAVHRVVVAGLPSEVQSLVEHIARLPHSGLSVAGVCFPGPTGLLGTTGPPVAVGRTGVTEGPPPPPDLAAGPASVVGSPPVVGTVGDLAAAARRVGADTIAIAGSNVLSGAAIRRLSWDLEGTGIRLLVSCGAPELAGRRLLVEPLGGLPLFHVKEAAFGGPTRVVKATIDRAGAGVLLIAASPLLAAIAIAVRTTSRGPVLFRQTRVGHGGRPFSVLKFRTMYEGADRDQHRFSHLNEHDGLLFKMHHDPRVTTVGRCLRRFSLDELPQLWNVLNGSMSLVGPRPPLPAEVERYPSDLRRRRHLVKPGITGLWQVSGRSDLSSEETVRLDLDYVENWSVGLDTLVLWKTVRAVLSSRGAY